MNYGHSQHSVDLTCKKIYHKQKNSEMFEKIRKIYHFLCKYFFYKYLNIETPMKSGVEKSELINEFRLFMILNNFEKYWHYSIGWSVQYSIELWPFTTLPLE